MRIWKPQTMVPAAQNHMLDIVCSQSHKTSRISTFICNRNHQNRITSLRERLVWKWGERLDWNGGLSFKNNFLAKNWEIHTSETLKSADQQEILRTLECGVGYRRWSSKFQKSEWVYFTFEQTSGIAMYISNLRYFLDNPLIWTDFQRSETDPDQVFRANFCCFLNFYHRKVFQNTKLFVLDKTRDCGK